MRRHLPLAVVVLGCALALPAPLWAEEAEPVPAEPVTEDAPPAPVEPPAEPAPAEPAPPGQDPLGPADKAPPTRLAVDNAPPTLTVTRQGAGSVSIVDFAFQPGAVEIDAGGSVSWRNNGGEAHTVTADDGSFDSGTLGVGNSFSSTFDAEGTFAYFCSIHPEMTGSVAVLASGGTGSGQNETDAGVPSPTEAAAVADPDAAGTGLPATGSNPAALAAIGGALLALGAGLGGRLAIRCGS